MLLMVKTSTCIGIMHEVFSLKYTFVSRQKNCHRVVGSDTKLKFCTIFLMSGKESWCVSEERENRDVHCNLKHS